jgi:hypothetical protein
MNWFCVGAGHARDKAVRGQHPQEVAMQATCNQPKAGQDRHRCGCKGLKPQQHTEDPLLRHINIARSSITKWVSDKQKYFKHF